MMRNRIKPNDIVTVKQTGEQIVVAGVDYEHGELIAKGWPFPSLFKIADCELMERCYETEPQSEDVIKELKNQGLTRFIDPVSALFHSNFFHDAEGEFGE